MDRNGVGMESEVGIEAASNITATCNSTALKRDVAAAAFRLSPLALRRMDFASLGPSNPPPNGFDAVVFGRKAEAGWLPAGRRGASGGVSAKRRRKQRNSQAVKFGDPLAREAGEDGAAKPRQVRGTGNRRTLRPPSTPAVRRSQPSPGASRLSSPASRARGYATAWELQNNLDSGVTPWEEPIPGRLLLGYGYPGLCSGAPQLWRNVPRLGSSGPPGARAERKAAAASSFQFGATSGTEAY